jgi:hypothetical protein
VDRRHPNPHILRVPGTSAVFGRFSGTGAGTTGLCKLMIMKHPAAAAWPTTHPFFEVGTETGPGDDDDDANDTCMYDNVDNGSIIHLPISIDHACACICDHCKIDYDRWQCMLECTINLH